MSVSQQSANTSITQAVMDTDQSAQCLQLPSNQWSSMNNEERHSERFPMFAPSQSSSWTLSDETSPSTSSFSNSGHKRNPSSNSSLSSVSSVYEHVEPQSGSKMKTSSLPDVEEDPSERNGASTELLGRSNSFSFADRWSSELRDMDNSFTRSLSIKDSYPGGLSDSESAFESRRKSKKFGYRGFGGFANRITRLPSIGGRKRSRSSRNPSGTASPLVGAERSNSRASSRARSFFRRGSDEYSSDADDEMETSQGFAPIAEVTDREQPRDPAPSPDEHQLPRPPSEGVERATTPLLPFMNTSRPPPPQSLMNSPLQSPTVATNSTFPSEAHTPVDGAQSVMQKSPVTGDLSSNARFDLRPTMVLPPSEVPAMVISGIEDEWAEKLGHTNYQIHPAPYMPVTFSWGECQKLFDDWRKARSEYAKHLARTNTHFGNTSRIYRLTEDKWSTVDSQWRKNYEQALIKAIEDGEDVPTDYSMEPAPVAKIPSLAEGKFPGDGDMVGPLEQQPVEQVVAPSRRGSRKATLMKALSGLQLPGSIRNRSTDTQK
ncbi:MAG: hypothetical protein M1831_003369 [Alyxoria varia]|nr:MAG: hypothetical protein M1831_003369 [Alyxoria varia]